MRDVLSVDGKPRPAAERKLPTLLAAPSLTVAELRLLSAENGHFNIGRIVRTFNEPTLALLFLDDQYRRRFSFTAAGLEKIGGQPTIAYHFVEQTSPTVIRDGARDLPARGTIWIDQPSGSVVQTLLELSNPSGLLAGRMTVTYRPHPKFDVLVPVEMRESYTSSAHEQVTAVATYSDFRRFETSGRLVLPR